MMHGWEVKTLGDVCSFENGDRGSNYPSRSKFVPKGIPFVNAGHLGDDGINFSGMNFITAETYELLSRGKFNQDDILFCLRGSLGKFALVAEGQRGAIASSLVIVRHGTKITANFLRYYFQSEICANMVKKYAGGAAQPNLGAKDLAKFQIPIPPLAEQKRIVAKLDQSFEAIDQAKANVERNLQNAKDIFQSQLNQIFSQKGDGWVERVLNDIGQIQTGTTPPTRNKSNYGNFIPFVKPSHFNSDGTINAGDCMLSKSGLANGRLFPANSVLMVCIGATIGKTGFSEEPVSANQQINCLTPTEEHNPKLFYFGLISPFVQKQVADTGKGAQATLPIINKSKWQKLKINIPVKKSVQDGIVNQLNELRSQTVSLEKKYLQELDALGELKKAILQKAFNGEL